jgi:hypothetical protein
MFLLCIALMQFNFLYAVSWLVSLHLGLLPCRPRFDPRPVHARFVVDRVAVGHVVL